MSRAAVGPGNDGCRDSRRAEQSALQKLDCTLQPALRPGRRSLSRLSALRRVDPNSQRIGRSLREMSWLAVAPATPAKMPMTVAGRATRIGKVSASASPPLLRIAASVVESCQIARMIATPAMLMGAARPTHATAAKIPDTTDRHLTAALNAAMATIAAAIQIVTIARFAKSLGGTSQSSIVRPMNKALNRTDQRRTDSQTN